MRCCPTIASAVDEIDRKLLALLQQDATAPITNLAEEVGLSATPVWKRVQRIEQAGVITGRVALTEPEQWGRQRLSVTTCRCYRM